MSLSTGQLETIAGLLRAAAPGSNPMPTLRRQMKGIAVAGCEAEDMRGETPFCRLPSFDLFLVDAASHCWNLVADPVDASGVIVAARAK